MRPSNKKIIALVFTALIIVSIAPKPASAVAFVPTWELNPAVTGDIVNFGEMTFQWAFMLAGEVLAAAP